MLRWRPPRAVEVVVASLLDREQYPGLVDLIELADLAEESLEARRERREPCARERGARAEALLLEAREEVVEPERRKQRLELRAVVVVLRRVAVGRLGRRAAGGGPSTVR